MSEIFLVRHGQASFGTDDYDQLSSVGEMQAKLLGHYFTDAHIDFDYVSLGAMKRQQQTADNIFQGMSEKSKNSEPMNNITTDVHSGWNEYDHEALFQAYIEEHRDDSEVNSQVCSDYFQDRRLFYRVLFRAMPAWAEGKIEGAPESWNSFVERVANAMHATASSNASRTLVSASAGSLSIAVMLATKMPASTAIDLMRQMKNTSISQLFYRKGQWHLHSFNTLPHLVSPRYSNFITYG